MRLLLLLHRQASHGYALIEGLDKLGMEAYPADVSAIYRILYDLEDAGMITSTRGTEQTAGPPRRVYELTEEGETYLAAWVQELEQTDRLLHRFLDAYRNRHASMAQAIADCQVLLCRGMGYGAYQSMQQLGIKPIVTDIADAASAALAYVQGKVVDHPERLH